MPNEKTKKTKWARRAGLVVLAAVGLIGALTPGLVLYRRAHAPSYSRNNATILQFYQSSREKTPHARLNIEFARTLDEQVRGLCCRLSLPADHGMLFVYDQPGIRKFWMKDTLIPLDIYWLDTRKTVIHIEENVQPSSYPATFGPDSPVQYVLETNAGYAKRHGIQVGSRVRF